MTCSGRSVLPSQACFPSSVPDLVGQYLDKYKITDDGWRIARRRAAVLFKRGSYAETVETSTRVPFYRAGTIIQGVFHDARC